VGDAVGTTKEYITDPELSFKEIAHIHVSAEVI
jgi:hypothetical protein